MANAPSQEDAVPPEAGAGATARRAGSIQGPLLAAPGTDRRRHQLLCIAGIAANTVFALATLFVSPSLVGTDPVLLEALRGSTASMVAGGAFARVGEASVVWAFLAPILTLMFVTPFYWWAGKLWGPTAAAYLGGGSPRADRWAVRSGRQLERWGGLVVLLAPYIPIPSAFIYAAAGWTGMSLRRFVLWDTLGMFSWIGLIVGLGYGIGHPAVRVAKEISHYGLEFTLGLVVVVMIVAGFRGYRAERAVQRAEATGGDAPLDS